jgi:uncharacterized RDD family membrane protein YckC
MDMTVSEGTTAPQSTDPPVTDRVVQYAGFWMRFWAYLVDLIVIGSVNRILIYPLLQWLDLPMSDSGIFSLEAILTAIVFYAYFVLMTKWSGQTLGKMVLGIRVVGKEDDGLPWTTVLFRELVGRFISKTIFFIGYIIVGFTNTKIGLHDIFADTYVIHVKK